jgi:LPXTG-motif cell wall-anchored protein
MRGRKTAVFGAASLMVALLAGPASAHATFSGVKTAPADSDQNLTLNVPEEKDPSIRNSGVVAMLPAGWRAIACDPIAAWHCVLETSPPAVRWTRDAGAPDVAEETFKFTVHTGPAGDFPVPVAQTYANGDVVRWDGPAGSETPAPIFRVTAAPAPPATSPTAPASPPAPTAAASPTPSTPASPPAEASPSPSPAAVAGIQQRPGQTVPNTGSSPVVPVVIGIILVALGAGAVVMSKRRKKAS